MKNRNNKYFQTAIEYYRNAKHILRDTPIELGAFYKSRKNVQKASGLCYLAVDNAIKGFLIEKGVDEKKLPLSWDGLKFMLFKYFSRNGKFRKDLEIVYRIAHINLCYQGVTRVSLVKEGFEKAKIIIENLTKTNL